MTDNAQSGTLADALGFSDDEVAANRRLTLSDRQRSRLMERKAKLRYYGYLALLILVVSVGLAVVIRKNGWEVAISGIIIDLLLGIAYYRERQNYDGDLASGGVKSVEGEARTSSASGRYGTYYYASFGDRQFNVGRNAYNLFQAGGRYRVYYAPNTKTLLSVERTDVDR